MVYQILLFWITFLYLHIMKKFTGIGFVFLLLVTAEIAVAQDCSLAGKIVHAGNPLANATITIKPVKKSVISGQDGSFCFSSLSVGKYILQVSMIGFETFEKTINLPQDRIFSENINLELAISSLENVVVTGTMKAVKRSESPVAVEIYTPQFFRKNPTPSIFEALQNVNGVRPQLNCNVCNTGDIHINGLEGPYTMITIDGMPIVSSLASVYGLFGIPMQLIDRVEIVKGPASGLYGSEAVGGLINIITKSPEKAPLFTADVMATSWNEYSVDAGTKFSFGKKAINLLGINYFNYQNPFDKNKDNFTDVTLQHRISVFNKTSFARKQNRVATLAGRFFYEDRWGGEMQWEQKFRGTDSVYGESIYTKRWELIGNYQLPMQEKMFFSFSSTSHNQNSFYGILPYMADQKIVFGQLLWDKSFLPGHSGLIGLAGRYNYYDDNSTATIDTFTKINRPDRNFIPGIFVQDEWNISPAHTLLCGLRYDHHPVHGSILTPRLAWKWKLNSKEAVRLNSGTGFRVVNLFTEEHAALTGARAVEIAEELKPERSFNVNWNYTNHLKLNRHSLLLDASVWYSYFNNQIIPDYETDPNKIIYKNLNGYSSSMGFTLNLEWNAASQLKLIAGTTIQDVAKFESINGKKQKSELLLTEPWSGTWAVTYTWPGAGISIDYTGNIYGPMKLPLLSVLDPRPAFSKVWSIQNLQFTKRVSKKAEFYTGVKNLLNWTPVKNASFIIARSHDPFDKKVEYTTNGSVVVSAENPYGLTFDPSYVYAPNQGIRFFAGMRMSIR